MTRYLSLYYFPPPLLLLSFTCQLFSSCMRVCSNLHSFMFELGWVRLCLPVWLITSQKSFSFSSMALAKTGPSPGCLSAANGGAGVGLLGHVSGWWPLSVNSRPLHDKGTIITTTHVEKSLRSCCLITGYCVKYHNHKLGSYRALQKRWSFLTRFLIWQSHTSVFFLLM